MKKNLINIYNALMQVETKGNSTKILAQCLNVLEQMVCDCDAKEETQSASAE